MLSKSNESKDQPATSSPNSARHSAREAKELEEAEQARQGAEDLKYVGQLVAVRTGLSQGDAEKRVTDRFTRLWANLKALGTDARAAGQTYRWLCQHSKSVARAPSGSLPT